MIVLFRSRQPHTGKWFLNIGVLQLTNDEKLVALEEHFKPHKLYRFPTHLEYKQRSCKQAWLDEYNWLVYDEAWRIANEIDVDIKRPRICGRQVHWQCFTA